MKTYFAYIRVSTARQGEEGVSLQEQRSAISEFAGKRGMKIKEWFEEQLSAATRGRPVFGKVINRLKRKEAVGIIIHTIDRSARNLKDWSDIAELMDQGVEVHFAHESIDLRTRSGRLSADILAVVASDYIRNLREETMKGIYGRLKQGLYHFMAPVGYLNTGKGKPKSVDSVRGPLINEAFDLYAGGTQSLKSLEEEMFKKGLRKASGGRLSFNHLATILRNPFYIGLMQIRGKKELFPGIYVPLVLSSVFNRVQELTDGRRSKYKRPQNHLFSIRIRCDHCGLFLAGELQKGHVYYRCHRRSAQSRANEKNVLRRK